MKVRMLFFEISRINPVWPSVAFHTETSRLISFANQRTGFYMQCITGLKWFNCFQNLEKKLRNSLTLFDLNFSQSFKFPENDQS